MGKNARATDDSLPFRFEIILELKSELNAILDAA